MVYVFDLALLGVAIKVVRTRITENAERKTIALCVSSSKFYS